MAAWHRSRSADLALRAAGMVLSATTFGAFAHVFARGVPARSEEAGVVLLAALGFLAASVGTAMAMLGHHLFDDLPVGSGGRRASSIETLEPMTEERTRDIQE